MKRRPLVRAAAFAKAEARMKPPSPCLPAERKPPLPTDTQTHVRPPSGTSLGPPRIIGILGSPRRNGNSAALLQELFRCLDGRFQAETVFLADEDIRPCDGCHACEQTGSCRIADDMPGLLERLRSARAIVAATPSYMGSVTSRMQMLMERTWPLRKGQMAGRIGTYIVTGRRRIGVAVSVLDEYFTRLGLIKVPGVVGFGFEAGDIARDAEALGQTRQLAAALGRVLGCTDTEDRNSR
jgi:multimeric flavodoxin WrbA